MSDSKDSIIHFGQNQINVLTTDDFDKSLNRKIKLEKELILFYYDPTDILIPIWAEISNTSLFPSFSIINLLMEHNIKKIIDEILNSSNKEKYYSIFNKTFENKPFILYYINGNLDSIYTSTYNLEDILSYSLSLIS
jgi:hypothetical protein